jgi:hypothetical protein
MPHHLSSSPALHLLLITTCLSYINSHSSSGSDDSYSPSSTESSCNVLLNDNNYENHTKLASDFDFENSNLVDLRDPTIYLKHCPHSPTTFSPCTGPAHSSLLIYTGLNVSETPEKTRTSFIDTDANKNINASTELSNPYLYGDYPFQGHLFAIPDAYVGRL